MPVDASWLHSIHPGCLSEVCMLVDVSWLHSVHPGCLIEVCMPVDASWLHSTHPGCLIEVCVPVDASWLHSVHPGCLIEVCMPVNTRHAFRTGSLTLEGSVLMAAAGCNPSCTSFITSAVRKCMFVCYNIV